MRSEWLVLWVPLALGCGSSEIDDGNGGAGGDDVTTAGKGKGAGPTTTKGAGQSGSGQSGTGKSGSGTGISTTQNTSVGPTSGVVSVSHVSGQTTGFVSTGVTTGSPFGCDTGNPGDPGSGECQTCAECATNSVCFPVYDACMNSMQCVGFLDCISQCGDENCGFECQMQYPQGALAYQSLVTCAVCDVCPTNCDAPQWGCQ